MNNLPFPWLALGMGLLVVFGLLGSGALGPSESYRLPTLTLLVVTEFGFFANYGLFFLKAITIVAAIIVVIVAAAAGLHLAVAGYPPLAGWLLALIISRECRLAGAVFISPLSLCHACSHGFELQRHHCRVT